MKKVMASGVFDILHLGHVHYLEESKSFGDFLVVVVASDHMARKGGKNIIFSEETRRKMISALKVVDDAIIGGTGNIYDTVEKIRPDIITLGFDQRFDENEIAMECRRRGMDIEVRRCTPLQSIEPFGTRKIREVLLQRGH